MTQALRRIIAGAALAAATAFPLLTSAQTELGVSTGPAAIEAAAPTCVKMTQTGEWISDPILHSPWTPMLGDPRVCWATFGVVVVVLYLLSFMLFQTRVKQGAHAVGAFGQSMVLFALFVAVVGYFTTGHLSYAQNWCIDHTMTGIVGAPPARSNEEIIAQFGVGINEIIDRGAIPLTAHARLTPWYLWAAGGMLGVLIFALGFRKGSAPSFASGGPASSDGSSSRGTGSKGEKTVEEW